MTSHLHRYAFDPTGKSSNNFVRREVRDLESRNIRAISPLYGAFFAESLVMRDTTTNQVLKDGTHYTMSNLVQEATNIIGKEIYSMIHIIDPLVSATVDFDYQAVGGKYEDVLLPILEMLDTLAVDNRSIEYTAITDKPVDFPPLRHMHDIGDMYGFESLTHAVDRAMLALELSSSLNYDGLYKYIDGLIATLAKLGAVAAQYEVDLHEFDLTAHPQYIMRGKLADYLHTTRKPTVAFPVDQSTGVSKSIQLRLDPYSNMYRYIQKSVHFQVATREDFSSDSLVINVDQIGNTQVFLTGAIPGSTLYYMRGRYQDDQSRYSAWSDIISFTTKA